MKVSGKHHALATTYGKEPCSQLGRRLGGPLGKSVKVAEKSCAPNGFNNQTIQPKPLTYTDYTLPAPLSDTRI